MKKLISAFLLAAMVLSLWACGGSGEGSGTEPEAPKGLQMGYARESIMPEQPVIHAISGGIAG